MTTRYNDETHRHEWVLDRWYQKTLYAIAMIYFALAVFGFIAGFILAILE